MQIDDGQQAFTSRNDRSSNPASRTLGPARSDQRRGTQKAILLVADDHGNRSRAALAWSLLTLLPREERALEERGRMERERGKTLSSFSIPLSSFLHLSPASGQAGLRFALGPQVLEAAFSRSTTSAGTGW